MTKNRESDIRRAVFRVRAANGDRQGTCFLIKDEYHVLTARHVINEGNGPLTDIEVEIENTWCPAQVRDEYPEQDVALLRLNAPVAIPPLQPSMQFDVGTQFRIGGFPVNFKDTYWHPGEVAGESPGGRGIYQIMFQTTYQDHLEGLSGGPVLDASNRVFGVFIRHDRQQLNSGEIASMECFYDLIDTSPDPENAIDFFIVLSETERAITPGKFSLQVAVDMAVEKYTAGQNLTTPVNKKYQYATDIVASRETYSDAIRDLCHAEVAIFDCTNYEPAVMLLLGIRSVVRRGVTISSVGGDYAIGDIIDLPFNIKEVNFMAHSERQKNEKKHPRDLIFERVRDGLQQSGQSQYLDLPTFDAVRNLPPDRRKPIPHTDSVMVFCSYGQEYQKTNWKHLIERLEHQFGVRASQLKPNILRIVDLTSPRLVSATIYEWIRRVDWCIVDWTEYRPNVFFELGVRLAVAEGSTINIIEKKYVEMVNTIVASPDTIREMVARTTGIPASDSRFEGIVERLKCAAQQCMNLLNLFEHIEYRCDYQDQSSYKGILDYLEGAAAYRPRTGLSTSDTYRMVEKAIDPRVEFAASPVYYELLQGAELRRVDQSDGRVPALYRNNPRLQDIIENGVNQRLLAAWYYLENEYEQDAIKNDPSLSADMIYIGNILSSSFRTSRPELAKRIRQYVKGLQS